MIWLLIISGLAAGADPPARIRAEVSKLQSGHQVPAVSAALLDGGRIAWAAGFGGVNAQTVFQAASISKPVAAMAALHMMQHGNFTLDEDVNGKLKTWKVPENALTKSEKVTLRRLLSHSAGLTVHGFPGYETGLPLPETAQILNGAPPANTPPVLADIAPGTKFRYSGGGYTVVQQLLADRIGWPFPQIMQRMVLGRIGMKRSSYEQPLPESMAANAAAAHDANGKPIRGRWHAYPEMAAAGLWTTPTDLALWAIELRETWFGRSGRVIERTTAAEMLKVQSGEYGLGVAIRKGWFSHGGSNAGYRAILTMHLESGKGAVIMTNSDRGDRLIEALLRMFASEYGWPER